jgi:hypothetical protein
MRGNDGKQGELFSYVSLEARIPQDHPLRPIRAMVAQAVAGLERRGTRRAGTGDADKAYDQYAFAQEVRELGITPHGAELITKHRGSVIDRRTTRHPGYALSQRKRKRVEEVFGWMKTVGVLRKARHRGTRLVGWMFECAAASYNLVRMRSLLFAKVT